MKKYTVVLTVLAASIVFTGSYLPRAHAQTAGDASPGETVYFDWVSGESFLPGPIIEQMTGIDSVTSPGFGTENITATSLSDSELSFVIPASAPLGFYSLMPIYPDGAIGNTDTILITDEGPSAPPSPPPAPVITSLYPSANRFAGSHVDVFASGLSATNNFVRMIDPSSGTQILEDSGLAANSGGTLGFTDSYPYLYVPLPLTLTYGNFEVQASVDGSTWSNAVPIIIMNPQNPPTNLVVGFNKSNQIKLTWKDNSFTETSFHIERAAPENPTNFTEIGTVGAGVTSYVDTSLPDPDGTFPEYYRVRAQFADGSYSDYSNTATLSGCTAISGTGPRKIVFMRGTGYTDVYISDLMSQANNIIQNGFSKIDPFKKYIGQFSFYADLNSVNELSLPSSAATSSSKVYYYYDKTVDATLKSTSSCGSGAFEYIFLTGNPNEYPAYNNVPLDGVVYMNLDTISEVIGTIPGIAVHESGHAVGLLNDEYPSPEHDTGDGTYATVGDFPITENPENCSSDPLEGFRSSVDNHMYGSYAYLGCFYANYYRPAETSLMVWGPYTNIKSLNAKFDVISCGYIVSAIDGEPVDQAHAQAHWPECKKLGTYSDGIPSPKAAPAIKGLSSTALSTNSMVSISGSGFTLDSATAVPGFTGTPNNAVQLINSSNSSLTYDIPELSSPDKKTISFILPPYIKLNTYPPSQVYLPSGTYQLIVGAYNSDWSKPVAVTITNTTANGEPPPLLEKESLGQSSSAIVSTQNVVEIEAVVNTQSEKISSTTPQAIPAATTSVTASTTPTNTQNIPTVPLTCPSGQTLQNSICVTAVTQTAQTPQASSTQALTAAITQLYLQYLGRTPDPSGLSGWLTSGLSIDQIKQGILASSEYANRRAQIAQMYATLLDRPAAPSDIDDWANSGLTIAQIQQGIMNSAEYQLLHGSVSSLSGQDLTASVWDAVREYYFDFFR